MSSPTATFCPLLAADLTPEIDNTCTLLPNVDAFPSMSELEADILDVGSDYSTCASDVNFFEPLLVHKTAILGIGFTASEKSDRSSELGNKETVAMMSDACETFGIDSDPIAKVFVES